jgi:membrane protease YdiL (CAAX protease family)
MNKRLSYERVAVFFVGFLVLWAASWLVALAQNWKDATAYWACAKTVVWVVYPLTIFVLSLVLGYVRQRSGSLVASMLVHATNNAFSIWWRN